jgi:arylsulfatase A-like enzyme
MFSRTLRLAIVALAIFAMDLPAGDEAKDKVAPPPPTEQIPTPPAKIVKEQIPTMPAKVVREQIPTIPAKVLKDKILTLPARPKPREEISTPPAKRLEVPSMPIRGGETRRPNIVLILADDIGYGDFGCYGAVKVKTPNVDRLAAQGRRFTDAHTPSAMCSPTRYALLTGKYAFRHGPVAKGVLSGAAPLVIGETQLTLAKILKQAGYVAGAVGKWHLGLGSVAPDFNNELKPGPLEVGFDYFFGLPATGDRVPCVYVENHRVVGLDPADPIRVSYGAKVGNLPTGKENPDLLTKMKPSHGHDGTIVGGISRIGFMEGGKKALWTDEDMADTFTKKAIAFIENNKDQPFFLYFATHDVHVPRVPHPRYRGTSQCGTRGDVIQEFDGSVGDILATLDRLKLADDTIVIVTSDNGGVMDDGYQDGSGNDTSGHCCNGILRGFKVGLYEGGHRVPFIIRWPGHVPQGTSDDLICLVDMPASFAALTKQKLPPSAAPDSVNVLPCLLGTAKTACRDHLVLHSGPGDLAIRQGDWVLIPRAGAAKNNKKVDELYNLAMDISQTTNVAARNPEIVRQMTMLLNKIRESDGSK